jgi:hypothetical protein
MIGEAIAKVQDLEKQVTGKTRQQLRARISIRACLKELRGIAAAGAGAEMEAGRSGKIIPFIARAPSLIQNP